MSEYRAQPEFWEALTGAKAAGVEIVAYECLVTLDGLRLDYPVVVEI